MIAPDVVLGPDVSIPQPTLVNLYREEDIPADRLALANAIKKIDPKAAAQLGIK